MKKLKLNNMITNYYSNTTHNLGVDTNQKSLTFVISEKVSGKVVASFDQPDAYEARDNQAIYSFYQKLITKCNAISTESQQPVDMVYIDSVLNPPMQVEGSITTFYA